ncbi:hypothetical protein HNQ07_002264 [Deinococcus metalli]|uniref:Uncharacterized protein n=1 Tax=Deinococcus metalli TaxID=1141878 RepID=A0A7W8KF71_9DEIO|nr:hypothetical protein [Deinococcus metalli]MBB5376800.1 hypothetical protein [Deinococcus metalli]GHF45436.1 hypothetical protein GCM10017781_22290 [Deinococcus metalli]
MVSRFVPGAHRPAESGEDTPSADTVDACEAADLWDYIVAALRLPSAAPLSLSGGGPA